MSSPILQQGMLRLRWACHLHGPEHHRHRSAAPRCRLTMLASALGPAQTVHRSRPQNPPACTSTFSAPSAKSPSSRRMPWFPAATRLAAAVVLLRTAALVRTVEVLHPMLLTGCVVRGGCLPPSLPAVLCGVPVVLAERQAKR